MSHWQGIYKGQSVAIMQCLRKSYYTISESTNFEHLTAELAALVIAEDTTTKMIQFASERAIQLPGKPQITQMTVIDIQISL